jgi:hypothetical protein
MTTPAYQIPSTGPVTPEEIYYLLLGKGLSTAQAIGAMANMKAESSLNPESGGIDSNGYWAGGLISWNSQDYPNAHSLVTGDPQTDVRAQINYLLSSTNNVQQGLQGNTAEQVAGNFANYVEACEGCTPGSSYPNGWSTRVGYAGPLLAAATTGDWRNVQYSTEQGQAGGTGSGSPSGGPGSQCLISVPIVGGCLLSTSQARALIGGLMFAPAAGFTIIGAVVLAAFAFRRSGAGTAVGHSAEAVGGAVALIPGGEAAGAAIAAAGSAEARATRARQQERTQREAQRRADREARDARAQERRDEHDYDRVSARTRDSRAGPAMRDEPPPF